MNNITRIGIDLAKNVFQLCLTDKRGRVIKNIKLKRAELLPYVAQLTPSEIVLEACGTSNYWARKFTEVGHKVKMIHPLYVRPFVKTNKNDAKDAEALCEAASRPTMRFVHPKTPMQQDIQLLHRVRSRLVAQRTALVNQTRGLLAEYGLVIPLGIGQLRNQLPLILEDAENELSVAARQAFHLLYKELVELDERVISAKKAIEDISREHEACTRLMTIPGVGPMVATAVYSVMGSAQQFRHGREFAAFLGLVPKQYSTGGKQVLRGISKRGDKHTRMLLIQGAMAALRHMHKKDDRLSRWGCQLKVRRGTAVTVVALANKIARICWALSAHQTTYQPTMG